MSDDETKDAKPAPATPTVEVSDEAKARFIEMAKKKIAGEMLPALKDPRTRMRTVVAMKVLAIVDREIGKGMGHLPDDWNKLRQIVAKSPEAVEMVTRLETAVRGYADDVERKVKAGEVDPAAARDAALRSIRLSLLKKIQIGRSLMPTSES
jgi:hypothetical protein